MARYVRARQPDRGAGPAPAAGLIPGPANDGYALSMYLARGGREFPGARVNANPLYQVPLAALGSHCLAGAGVGNACAALELTIEAIRERSTNYTAMRMRDFQAVQLRVARAGAMVDTARLVIRADCLEADRIAREARVP